MAKKQKSPKNAGPQFPDLHFEPIEAEDGEAKQQKAEPNAELTAVLARVDSLEKELSAQRRANRQLMSQSFTPNTPPEVKTQIDASELPDPVDDPTAFVENINKQVAEMTSSQSAAQQYQQNQQDQLSQLWADFQVSHPEYKDDFDKVQIAAERTVRRASTRGMDVTRYMFGDQDGFFGDVVEEMTSLFRPVEKPGKEEEGEGAGVDPDFDEGSEEELRTMGLAPGSRQTVSKATKVANEDMVTDMQKWQQQTGFHA